jgi:DNA-binding XRE family transcriptional regulator
MLCCSEQALAHEGGVAYGQRRWKGIGMEETPVEDGSLILAALGAAIREHRVQAGLTQAALAERAGIGRPHLNHIEGGRKNPTVVVLVHLAHSLGVTPGDLLQPGALSETTR